MNVSPTQWACPYFIRAWLKKKIRGGGGGGEKKKGIKEKRGWGSNIRLCPSHNWIWTNEHLWDSSQCSIGYISSKGEELGKVGHKDHPQLSLEVFGEHNYEQGLQSWTALRYAAVARWSHQHVFFTDPHIWYKNEICRLQIANMNQSPAPKYRKILYLSYDLAKHKPFQVLHPRVDMLPVIPK